MARHESERSTLRRHSLGLMLHIIGEYERNGAPVTNSELEWKVVHAPHYFRQLWVADNKSIAYDVPAAFRVCDSSGSSSVFTNLSPMLLKPSYMRYSKFYQLNRLESLLTRSATGLSRRSLVLRFETSLARRATAQKCSWPHSEFSRDHRLHFAVASRLMLDCCMHVVNSRLRRRSHLMPERLRHEQFSRSQRSTYCIPLWLGSSIGVTKTKIFGFLDASRLMQVNASVLLTFQLNGAIVQP